MDVDGRSHAGTRGLNSRQVIVQLRRLLWAGCTKKGKHVNQIHAGQLAMRDCWLAVGVSKLAPALP